MGHTNSTANLALPQFIGTDKPTWLSDVNGAFAAIDTYAGNNDAALAITDAKADTAIGDAASAVTTAGNAATTAGNAAATATAANTVAGNALTVANGINSKVGVLTDLVTTDKSSVVNAINEVAGYSGLFDGVVKYDAGTQELKYYDEGTQTWITIQSAGGTYKGSIIYYKGSSNYIIGHCVFTVDANGDITLASVDSDDTQNVTVNTTYTDSDPSYGLTSFTPDGSDIVVTPSAGAIRANKTIATGLTSTNAVVSAYLPANEASFSSGTFSPVSAAGQAIMILQK